jgi:putative membrane protein
MRINRTLIAFLAAALVAAPAMAGAQAPGGSKSDPKGTLAESDRKFVMEAARGGVAEVELGKLAGERASNDAVKQFGQRMVTDHGKANEELKELAQQKKLTLPTGLDSKHRKLHDRLSKLSGAEFDRAYVEEMVKDHRKDVTDFRREAERARDADLKTWAGKTLPTLEDHLKQVQSLQAQVKASRGTTR